MSTSSNSGKTAAKKAAASPAKDQGADKPPTEGNAQEVPNPAGNSGPQTGTEAPEEKVENRPPATVVGDPDGAPLEPPKDAKTQTQPEAGYQSSTTDPVYAQAGGHTIAGEEYVGLSDIDGKPLKIGSIFDDSDASKTFVTVKTRVYEDFYYPNTTEKARRLLFPEGKRVPRAQAEQIKRAVADAPEPTLSDSSDDHRNG